MKSFISISGLFVIAFVMLWDSIAILFSNIFYTEAREAYARAEESFNKNLPISFLGAVEEYFWFEGSQRSFYGSTIVYRHIAQPPEIKDE